MIITGDLKQTDKPLKSGLSDFISRFHRFRNKYIHTNVNVTIDNTSFGFIKDIGIHIMEFNNSDIQRHAVVSKILEIYEDDDNVNTKYIKYDLLKQTNIIEVDVENSNTVSSIEVMKPFTTTNNKNDSKYKSSYDIDESNDAALIPKRLYKRFST